MDHQLFCPFFRKSNNNNNNKNACNTNDINDNTNFDDRILSHDLKST